MGAIDFVSGGGQYKQDDASRKAYDAERDKRRGAVGNSTALDDQSRANQDEMARLYADRIAGKAPSVAQQQMEGQNASNKAQQLAMARSGGGGALGQAGAMRTAQQTASQQDLGLQRNAGLMRAQEQATAEQGLSALYSDQRSQDQARIGQQMGYEGQLDNAHNAAQAAAMANYEQYATRRGGGTGGLISAGAVLGGSLLSDERMKTGVEDLPPQDVEAFLEAAAGHRYKYREGSGEDPNRERVGVMAQDLEGTRMGSTFVDEGPDGVKGIDTGKGYGAMLAAMHEMHARIKELEGKKGGK